jgi:hypothetical protein
MRDETRDQIRADLDEAWDRMLFLAIPAPTNGVREAINRLKDQMIQGCIDAAAGVFDRTVEHDVTEAKEEAYDKALDDMREKLNDLEKDHG